MQTHATAADTADHDALEQRDTLARGATAPVLEVAAIVGEAPDIAHIFLPADVARVRILQADFPLTERHQCRRPERTRPPPLRSGACAAIDIGSGVSGVLE